MVPLLNKFTIHNSKGTKMYTLRTFPLTLAPGYPVSTPKLLTHLVQPQRKYFTQIPISSFFPFMQMLTFYALLPCFSLEHSVFVHKEMPFFFLNHN